MSKIEENTVDFKKKGKHYERKDPTSFLPEEPMSYEIKPKKKKKKKNIEDPFKDIEEKVKLPTVTVFDPTSDSALDPEVSIKVENIEVELDFNDFANDNGLMVEGPYSDDGQPEAFDKLGQENKKGDVLRTFQNIINDKPSVEIPDNSDMAPNYVCKVCHLVFQSPKTLIMHQRRKHKVFRRSFKHICDYCSMSYETKNSLVAHIKRKHGPDSTQDDGEERTCEICALVFKGMGRLRMHMRRKHGSFKESFKHVCKECGLTYEKHRSLIVHIRRKHSGIIKVEDRYFNCPFCPMVYNKRETYARHVHRKHRRSDDDSNRKLNNDIMGNIKNTETGELCCTECPLVFSTLTYLKLHMRRKHNAMKEDFRLKCKICNLSYDKIESLKRHVRRKHDKVTYCDICRRQFDTHEAYLGHTHAKIARECPVCGLIFASQSGLGKHLRCAHEIAKPKTVICHLCNAAFHTKRQLKPHFLRVHLKVSYTCQFCKKVLKSKETYTRHILMKHHNDKPSSELQICEHCAATFSNELELRRHCSEVHNTNELNDSDDVVLKNELETDVAKVSSDIVIKKEEVDIPTKYQCTKCPEFYPNWDQLKLHYEQNHYVAKETQCQLCGKLVPDNELAKHIKSHNDTTLRCRYCNFSSNNRASMTQHLLRHKNATTINCSFENCKYKTFYEDAMEKHKRKHIDQGVKLQCTQCPFQTMNKYILKYHEEAHVTGKKRYACDQCDYATILPAALVQHKYKHSTEKRFKCEVCPFATKYNTSLRFHVKKKHCDLPS
ncbi:zinc finger protein 26-like isoform X1 [Pieris napi]|uniref:zinc finger protein 26-like isoform X1 n=1 Tax=Pieris napi TaxID=78633 RepID=UPI001FB9C4AF|nr:zinc finger protein 26-like isoform X1 [Pieris napi]XP_047513578.1 zinc finger protein 26-like isoform X1 [Pieris napi]